MNRGYAFGLLAFGLVLLLTAACDKRGGGAQTHGAASAAASASSAAAADPRYEAEIERRKREVAARLETRQTRMATTKFSGLAKTGKRQARFLVTNQGKKKLTWAQAWVYYYDDDGKYLDRFPESFDAEIAPAATREQALGYGGSDIPEGSKTFDCEITAVEWEDGTSWVNENLVMSNDRKPGGPSHQELMKREGEMVLGTWTGKFGSSGRPLLKLTNISGRPLQVQGLWIFYYTADGEQLDRQLSRDATPLAAGGTIEIEAGALKSDIDKDTKRIEAAISAVKFQDGRQEVWKNENLSNG